MEDQELEDLFELFRSKGWKLVMEDFGQLLTQATDVMTVTDGDGLQFRKGQLDILLRLTNYEALIRRQQEINESEDS